MVQESISKGIDQLPIEIISSIFQYLDFKSLIKVMTLNSVYFQMSSQFLLSGQFNRLHDDEKDENKTNINSNVPTLYNDSYSKDFKLKEEQCLFLLTKLLELFKKQNGFYTLNRIDLTHVDILDKRDEIFELVVELIKEYEVTELLFDFTFFTERQELLFESVKNKLTLVKASNMSSTFMNHLSSDEECDRLQHLFISQLPYNFTNYNILKNLKTLELTLILSAFNDNQKFYNFFTKGLMNMSKLEELNINIYMDLPQRLNEINIDINLDFIKSFENCKNLKKFSFISYQSYTTAINWRLPETDDSVVNYLKEKEVLFPNLKELKLNFKATENSQHFLQYLIKKNVNLDKLTISYLSYKNSFKLIERIDKINDLKILHNSYENVDQKLQKRSQPIEVNKLIIQALLNPNHFLQLVDNLKLKEIYFIYGTIDYKNHTNYVDYNLENLNELQFIYTNQKC